MKAKSLYIQKLAYDENTGNEIIGLFPSEANPAIVSSYTYDAKRMGGAPTLTATIYSSEPLQWKKEEFVEYNGDRFFASYTPNSTKDNTSRMWKSEITFTSRRELLDNTLFFDVVVDDVDTQNKDRYRSNQTKFTFGGTIHEFVARVNSSMAYCGLYRPTDEYKGYYVVVDEGYGTDEVKEVSFEDQYLTDVLQLINTTFELDYYWDGNVCHVGKVQHDLTDTPIKYGSSDALISVSKENANYKIVDMITGYGSSDNLPYYYPNDDEFGEAVFNTENISKDKVSVDLSKFLKGSKYNDVLVLYKSKYGQKYSASIDSSLFGLTRNTEPENLTLADNQTNPTVTCSFGFSFYVKLIKGQILDFTKLSFKFGMLDSLTHKDNITEITAAYKDIYLSNGNDIITITKKTVFGDNCKYPCENDGEYKLTIWAEFSYRCRVFRNGNGVTDYYGANSWNASFSGNIGLLYEPTSEYEWKNEDKYIPYGESGINIREISGANCIEYDYQFFKDDNRYGFNKVYSGTDDNATKVVVTDRVWIAPSSVLMPSIYRNSKGAERFYYAFNNTHKLPSGIGYYEFVNLYKKGNPHQGTVTFDDIKPTINGIVNAEGQLFGEIADVAFDKEDSDVKDSDGNYIHSYFYIKLHKFNGDFGFDLFAHALASESAKINLIKSNGCPACSFVIYNKPSADNSKCYNRVSVDENGNLKQVRTDKNDYIFANASDAYEDNLNQDSTQKELWIAVQKDTSTLGIVMPNASAGFKPQKGDLFVITGIKPPKVLVTAAEKRLDDALVKHMSENNTDQFNYSVKFSRIFLQENPDFASKLNENAKLSIQIQGDYDNDGNLISHKVFVSNYSVKVDNDELAEVEIELVNLLEVTKSDTKQIIDAVKGEAVKSLSSIVCSSNANSFNASIADKMYLSKLNDDTAKGTITWEKIQNLLSGLLVGNFNSENGGSWTPDTEGRSHLITDYLEVRMKAIFEELVIKKTSTISGKEIISPAGGVVAHKVEEVTVTYNNVSQKAYRCYFLAEQEGDAVDNDFAIGDQVRSESFNVRKGTYHKVGNHFYWRLVIGRDEDPVGLEGKKYHYIDLSDTDCATASDVPAKGDVLSQCGNRTDVERQNCLIFSAVDTYSPSISLYHGINSYSFANREYVQYGVNKQTNKAFFNVYGDMYVGDRPTKENGYEGSSYIKYDSATKQVSVKGKISAKSTVDGKELSQYIKENSAKGLTEEQVNNLIKNSQVITDLQNQVDGAIETWFYEGVPTLNNAPASSWTTDKDKDTHLGDLYYDNKTGKAYRFAKDGNTYKWTIITDTDIAKALSDASKAQETADGKMKVFSTQPIPPYQLGDIWVNATYPTDGRIYKNEILRCQTAKAKDSSFAIADWTKASKYTDDSALNTFKEEYKNDMASYKEQLDEKVETWFYNYAPTTQNKPASDWTTDTLKSQHAGDLFYNTSNGYTYRWTGTAWARIKDNDINTAMTAASKAQDTADGKRTVFTSQPTVPYDEGDLWASGGDDGKTLMVCVKSRATGSFTSSEWVKANDSDLNAFAKTIEESLTGIRDQLDKKAETWYQATDPSTSWTTDDAKKEHKGDLWYNTSNNQTFFWNGTKWDKQDVPTEVFDKIDGKSSIYVSKPASYEERDLWILEAAYTLGGVAYSKGELVVATKSNASFSAADWTKKVKYTDDTVANTAKKAAEEAKKAADTAQTNVTNLGKTVTSNKKAFDSYVTDGYLEPSEIAAMAQDSKRLEDAFAAAEKSYNEVKGAEVLKSTKELTDLNTAFTTLSTAKKELITYLSDISTRYNAADTEGKANIVSAVGTKFTNFQPAYSAFYDKLGLANAYITSKIYGDLKQNITDLAGYKYIKDALGQTTDIDGGLVMTTLLALRDADGNVQSGINGAIDTNRGKKSIATWWGGQMVDKDYNSGSLTPATSLVRFDGSGYLANGAIWWDVDGKVHADPTSFIISEKNLGAYLAFFEPTWKSGSNGTNIKDLVALTPQAPFTTLSVSNDLLVEGKLKLGSITLSVVNGALKIDGNVYSTGGMSAYGDGTNNGGGGGLVASVKSYTDIIKGTYTDNDLASIPNAYAIKALSNRIDNISSELGGLSLDWANITGKPSTFTPSAHTHKWVDITDRITKVSQLTNDSGYTTNKGTVTSVKLTLPTGLSLGTTKEITTSGTFAISLTSGYSIPTTSKQGQWDSAYNWYKLMTTDEETADGVINKWNEVVDFLAGIAQTDSLDSILSGINKSITDETNRAKKAEGANATNIATNKANITTLQGYFTNGSAKSAIKLTNARKLWGNSFDGTADISGSIVVPSGKYITIGNIKLEYDATNKALKITNTSTNEVANLYTSGGVSAYGVGTTSSGSTGGGGLNGTVKSYNDAKSLTSESLSEVASAYSVAALYSSINDAIGRINTLEGGSATSIEVTGSGNAVTGVSKSGTKLTFTKGATFLTSHQDISGKSDKTHTHSVKINGVTKTIAATGGTAVDLGTYLTSHQSLAAYLKSADAEKTYSKLGHTHAFSEITGKPTTLAGYGVTDGVNTVTLSGSGNAVTSASIDGHTLTLTKGSTFSLSGHTHTFASLTSKPTTIAGYGITDAYTKAQVNSTIAKYLPLAGGTITGVLTVNGIATFKSKIAIGDIYIINDGSGNLYVQKTDGKTAANFYATGGITAFGASSVSGGTGSGLNGSVLGFEKATAMTSADNGDSSKTEVSFLATAWSIKQLNDKINAFGTGVFSDYLTIAAAKATYQPKGSYLTSHQTIYGLTIQKNGTSLGTYTPNSAAKTINVTVPTKLSELSNDSGYTKNTGTVTSVAISVPTGLSVSGSPITTNGTIAIALASGYSIPTTAKQTAWDGAVSAKHTHSNKSVLDGISSTKVSHWNSAYDWYALMTTDEETADGIINKWNEVVSFLANIAQTDTLSGIVDGINKSISDEVARAKKAEGVNASGISANKGSIATLQGYFTNGSAKKALQLTNARKLWGNSFNGTADINGSIIVPSGKYISIGNIKLEYDATNKALKITNTSTNEVANLYTSGGVSAYGVGTTSSGSTGGGGLNGTVKSYNDAKSLTSESLSEVASAYSVAALYSSINDAIGRINTLEGGSATSIEVTGSGNAVTGVSKSGTKLTFTKGATFLTSHQDISGKSDKTHTHSVKINGVTKTIAATGGTAVDLGTYLTSHQSLAAYLKSADAEKTYSKLGHTHAFSEITGKPTTLAGYGVTDGVNTVTLSGSGNAVTSASIDGHTLTLTKGSTFSLSGHTHTFASLTSKPTTIAGYGITDAYTKAQVNSTIAKYLPLAGGTITGVLTVNGIATFKSKIAIGDIYIINDGSGNLYVQKTDGKTAANFYATGGITAFGASSVSGGTGSGLNGSVLGFEKATAMTSADNGDSSKTEVSFLATAWSIKQLNDKINAFGTGVFSDYLTIAAAKATYQPKGSYLTSHQTIYGLTIQKNGTSLGTYTPNSAAKTINVTVPTKLSELSNDSGYTKNTGTVTSVAISVPTGLSVSGSPITTNGTIAIALASGYSIPTTAKQTAWDGAVSAKHTHSNKSVLDGISSTKVSHWNSAYDWYALMTTDEETADGIINKWNEVVSFLANIAQTDTLSGIVDGINKSISDEVARAKKAEGVNASGISANKGSIATLQGYFTNGSAKKALQLTNARKLWGNSFNGTADINGSIIVPSGKYISIGNIKLEYDAANKALKITNTTTEEVANLYTSGGVSAYGAGTSSSSGGGGLNGSVKAYNDALKLTSESLSEIASAYSIKALDSRISSLEGGSATSIETTGSGNAVTSVSKSGTKITFTKGSTFSLNGHTHTFASLTSKPTSLSGYGITDGVNAVSVTGSGNAVTAASVSGHTLTLTKGSTFSLSNHTHYVGTTQVQGSSAEQALTGITKIDNILKLSKATVTVNTSYKAEQNRLVIYGNTYGNDANYIKSARKLSYGDGGPQLVFSTNENPDASGVQSAALVYTDHDTIGAGVSLSFVTNQGDAYFIAPHIKALTAFQGNLAWSYITNKPTTLSGFGITDGLRSVTHPSGSNVFVTGISTSGTAITYTKSYTKKSLSAVGTSGWTNASIDGNIIPDMSFIAYWNGAYSGTSSNLAYCNKGAFGSFAIKNSLAFSELTSKPTTISGYGITDAYTKSQVDAIAAKYLPLTGGTLTGQLKIVASALNGAYNGLLIGDDCYIGDCNFANTIGLMGSTNSNAGMVKFGKGGMQFGYNGSNHIASTTAQWTNLNADLLDGWHKDNIVWSGAVNSNTANLSHYWAKLFDITVTDNLHDDRSFTFLFSNGYNDTYSVVVLRIRQNGANGSGAYNFNIALRELVGNMSSRLRVYYNNATGNVQLWGNCQDRYGCLSYTIIKKTGRTSADFKSQGTLVTNTSFSAAQSLPATTGDSPYILLDGATRIGIVKQADQLVTARTIWGQSFNGTANVSGNMTGVGNINTSAAPAGTIYTNNWFRSKGNSGWYSEDHGGGWYMTDNTWIRSYGSKDVYLSNKLSVNGNVGIGTTAPSHKLHVLGEIYTTTKVNINGIVLEKDSDGNLKVNGNLYATGGISAYGTSSAGSGGGLSGSVLAWDSAIKMPNATNGSSDTTKTESSFLASAWSIKQLYNKVTSLEGGSAMNVSVSGSGNAVTSISKSGTTISVVKGSTFLTAHQSLAGYMKTATADAKYMYHSRNNIVSDLNSFATNGAAHIYEMNNVTNRPNSNSWVQVMNWGTGDSAYGFLLANDYSTNGHMYFRQKIAGSWKDWKTIIDSSNIGSQSVNYAASAGSVAWTNVSGRPSTMKNPSALSWSGYSSGSYDGSAAKSISIPNNTNQLTNGAGFITASASITGNAASATKLQTTRTLWGQSFNGTANISGSMTGVGDMTLDAGARIKHGSGNLYIGNSDNSNWIGVQDICSQSSIGDGNWSLRTSGAAHFKDTTINGTATIKNLLSLVDGSHKGLKMGSTYISSLDGEVILQGNTALRFGNDAWDYNQWAGLKYDHSIKTVYLGIADGSIFKANSAQSGGVINLKQGISSVYTPALYAGGDIYHTGVYRMLWKNSKASKYLNVMNISQDDNGILTIGYGNFSNNKNVVLEGYNLNFRVGNDSGTKSMWFNYNNGNPVLSLDGNFYATGGVTAYKSSDERLKHDIHGVDSLAIIKAMGGTVAFRYNADNKDSIGWIAQRVLHNTFMQDLVEKDDKGFLKINYWSPKLIAVAFGAIEQVDDEVSRLKRRVRDLENEVEQLKSDRL